MSILMAFLAEFMRHFLFFMPETMRRVCLRWSVLVISGRGRLGIGLGYSRCLRKGVNYQLREIPVLKRDY